MDILTTIGDFINSTKNKIGDIAVKAGFKIRKGKIMPETFVMAMTVGQTELHEVTLDTLAGKCEELQDELIISKQAIHQRMEVGSEMMRGVFNLAFSSTLEKGIKLRSIEVLKQFKDIKLNDGTTMSLPDKLEPLYKGLGGKNAKSAIKIQATYSVFQNEFVALDFFPATKNDATYNEETLRTIEPGELMIKDLGYFDKDYFYRIESKQAFYISRIKSNSVIYIMNHGEYNIANFAEILKTTMNTLDIRCYIKLTSGDMHEIRLTGIRLPEEACIERKRKAYKNAKNNNRQLTREEIILLDWFLVIINIPDDMLSIETLCELYRLRWQIELQFKALKTSMDFDKFGNVGKYYFKCLFYGKLIMHALTMRVFAICRLTNFNENNRLISVQKFVRNFRNSIKYLVNALLNTTNKILDCLEKRILRVDKRSFFDVRKRKSTEEKLMEHDLPESVLTMLTASNY